MAFRTHFYMQWWFPTRADALANWITTNVGSLEVTADQFPMYEVKHHRDTTDPRSLNSKKDSRYFLKGNNGTDWPDRWEVRKADGDDTIT